MTPTVTGPSSPSARRLRTPGWFDIRLVLGVVLVAACVAIGARVIGSAGSTDGVLVARRDLAAGIVLQQSDMEVRQVRLSGAAKNYFGVHDSVAGKTMTAPVRAGDLVPRSAVESRTTANTALVPIPVDSDSVSGLTRGDRVEVLVSGQYCRTLTVLSDVAVQDVERPASGALSASGDVTIHVLVPKSISVAVSQAVSVPEARVTVIKISGPTAAGTPTAPDLSSCYETTAATTTTR